MYTVAYFTCKNYSTGTVRVHEYLYYTKSATGTGTVGLTYRYYLARYTYGTCTCTVRRYLYCTSILQPVQVRLGITSRYTPYSSTGTGICMSVPVPVGQITVIPLPYKYDTSNTRTYQTLISTDTGTVQVYTGTTIVFWQNVKIPNSHTVLVPYTGRLIYHPYLYTCL